MKNNLQKLSKLGYNLTDIGVVPTGVWHVTSYKFPRSQILKANLKNEKKGGASHWIKRHLPVKLLHSSISNQRSINCGKIISSKNDGNSVRNIRFSPVLSNTNSSRIIRQIHQSPNNNLIVDCHLSVS